MASVAGAMIFRDQRDVPAFRRLLAEIDSKVIHRVAFALPAGTSWPLPLYELALLSAGRAAERGLSTEITLVTPRANLDSYRFRQWTEEKIIGRIPGSTK